jgi:hypothetical protein
MPAMARPRAGDGPPSHRVGKLADLLPKLVADNSPAAPGNATVLGGG